MSHKLILRFDIDTHKCIRDGVPNLLNVSEQYGVPFSFFLNVGKSVSFFESIKDICNLSAFNNVDVKKMSARTKLGFKDYLVAAIFNPSVKLYKKQIKQLLNSNCEVGIHGGQNHALWQKYADTWSSIKIEQEITWALDNIKELKLDYEPIGFASPAWNNPSQLDEILLKLGFLYSANLRCLDEDEIIDNANKLPHIGVNLLGEPGGVAFFEYCRACGMSDDDICNRVVEAVFNNEVTVLYDHPYYAGIKELELIKHIIEVLKDKDIEFCKLCDLIKE